MINDDILTLAINLLRDCAESRRMPSGACLPDHAVHLHHQAAERLERVRAILRNASSPLHPDPPAL